MATPMEMLAARFGLLPQQSMADNELNVARNEGLPEWMNPIPPQPNTIPELQRELAQGPNNQPPSTGNEPQPQSEMDKWAREYAARQAAERREYEKYLEKDRAGIAGLEESLKAQLGQRSQTDLSPLMALSDTWFGGNLSKGYAKPQSSNDNAQQGLSNMMALQQRKEALTTLAKKADDSGSYLKLMMAMKKDEGTQSRSDRKVASKFTEDLISDIQKPADELENAIKGMDDLETAFKDGDYQKVVSKLESYGRVINGMKGAGTEGDVARQLLPTLQMNIEKAGRFLDGGRTRIDPKALEPLLEVIKESKGSTINAFRAKVEDRNANYLERARAEGHGLMGKGQPGEGIISNSLKKVERYSNQPKAPLDTRSPQSGLDPNEAKRVLEERRKKNGG